MKRNFVVLAIVLILTGLVGLTSMSLAQQEIAIPPAGKWEKKADMPTARYNLSAEGINGLIYAMGGMDVFDGRVRWLATVEVYNPATDTWKKGTDMPAPRSHFATAVVDGKIYAFGGLTQVERRGRKIEKTVSAIEAYDPAADAWQKIGDSPQARQRMATAELNGKVYLSGGSNNVGGGGTTVEVYDVATTQWKKLANLNEKRSGSTASAVNSKIYAIGGFRKELTWLKTVEEYDPAKNEWTQMASMPTARQGLSVTAVRGQLYAIGGGGEGDFLFGAANPAPAFANVEEYTPPGWPFAVEPAGKLATMWGTIKSTDQ